MSGKIKNLQEYKSFLKCAIEKRKSLISKLYLENLNQNLGPAVDLTQEYSNFYIKRELENVKKWNKYQNSNFFGYFKTKFEDKKETKNNEHEINFIFQNIDVNLKDQYNRTLLYYAVYYSNKIMVKILLENNGNTNFKDKRGMSHLDFAKYNKDFEIASLLENHQKTKINIINDDNNRDSKSEISKRTWKI